MLLRNYAVTWTIWNIWFSSKIKESKAIMVVS